MDSFLMQYDYFKGRLIDKLNKEIGLNKDILDKIIKLANENYADYAIFFKALKTDLKPEELIKRFQNDDTFSVNFLNGYINFKIKTEVLAKYTLNTILIEKENYGKINYGKNKTVVIDYSSPNIAKPFSIGHLRSTVLGDALKRLYTFLGYKAIGINFLGDYGTQFGKLLYAYKYLAKGSEKQKQENLKKYGIKWLMQLYVKFHEIAEKDPQLEKKAAEEFKKLENGDKKQIALWKIFKETSMKEFQKIYDLLGIEFETYESESEVTKYIDEVIEMLKQKGLLIESNGAQIVDLKKYNLGVAIILKSDGTTIYLSRDLCSLIQRYKKYKFEKILYVTGSEQSAHFKQLFKIFSLLGFKAETYHVNFGLYQLKNKKISTRKGNVIYMEDVIKKVIDIAKRSIVEKGVITQRINEYAKKIAISAIKFNDLSQDRIKNITFDWNQMLRLDGDTSVYVNYALVRALSILNKAEVEAKVEVNKIRPKNYNFKHKSELRLIKSMYKFPLILKQALEQHKPHIIARYLIDLAKQFNEFYKNVKVLNAKNKEDKLSLVLAFTYVIKTGFNILGLEYVDKM